MPDHVKIHDMPQLTEGRMILGLSGWMDGGDVSTGTVEALIRHRDVRLMAELDGEDFYLLSFPGSMEVASLFRPHTRIEEGVIQEFDMPSNTFFADVSADLVLFVGKEPNLHWTAYADAVLGTARAAGVRRVYFVGSVAGLTPHTREPRLYASVSDPALKPQVAPAGVSFSNYEGPASIVTYLSRLAPSYGLELVTLVAEIPAYVEGHNPKSIEAMTRTLATLLNLSVDLSDLRTTSDEWEKKLDETVAEREELAEQVHKLEEEYDSEHFDTQMGDLKDWLEQKGVRLD